MRSTTDPQSPEALLSQLRTRGVALCSSEDLGLDLGTLQTVYGKASSQGGANGQWDTRNHSTEMPGTELLDKFPDVYRLGAQPALVHIASEYFGRQPILYDVTYRRDHNVQEQRGIRQWHRDREADRVFKALVYLNDVGSDGGGFQYVERDRTPWRGWFRLFPQPWRFSDRAMSMLVPDEHWDTCSGVAGTVVLVDAAALYHHGTNPAKHRDVVTFSYVPLGPPPRDVSSRSHVSRLVRNFRDARTLAANMIAR
ncbi:MAG: hypothetical protein KUG77_07935 [Nannocystaceae bacterium]|nr:hypothetical protein [Nannocystaceae bacterium]